MNQSIELKELMLQAYEAMAKGDVGFYEHYLAEMGDVLIIGTDPNEWWADRETINRIFKNQIKEMNGVHVIPGDLLAYSMGDTGWAADRPVFRLADGTEVPFRMTVIFLKEGGVWKILHQHVSIGVPNDAAIGQDLTTS